MPEMLTTRPPNEAIFGPSANCTLQTCPLEWSVYQYRPSLPANVVLLAIFTIAWNIHVYLGIRWRTVLYMNFMMIGCGSEMIGYIGRVLMWKNPFAFPGFMLQVLLITGGPVFFSAAIYITLSVTMEQLAPELSRLRPALFYWLFISADMLCVALQAAGGALSTVGYGVSATGVKVALAGLSAQAVFLPFVCVCFADYMLRYRRDAARPPMPRELRRYFAVLAFAVACILGRCCYRCYELSRGYRNSTVITNEGLFIGLEGVLVVVAVFALMVAHPGRMFKSADKATSDDPETLSTEK